MKRIMLLLSLLCSFNAWAVDVYNAEEIPLVSSPVYIFDHELGVRFDYFPVGAFNKHIGLSGEYTHFIKDENFSWTILAGKSIEIESSLKANLVEGYGAKTTDFLVLNYYAKGGISYVPFIPKTFFSTVCKFTQRLF